MPCYLLLKIIKLSIWLTIVSIVRGSVMLNLSSTGNYKIKQPHAEKIEMTMLNQELKPKLPRHISCLETTSYSQSARSNAAVHQPLKCPLNRDPSQREATNLAVNILKYQLKDYAAQQKHLANLLHNLKYRLQVANAKGNRELVDLLQKEFTELATKI